MTKIQEGDRVRYSTNFLRSIGCYTGALPFARGTVASIKQLGSLELASVDWDKPNDDVPGQVNVQNLSKF